MYWEFFFDEIFVIKLLFFSRELCEASDTFSMPDSQLNRQLGNQLFQKYLINMKFKDQDFLQDFNKVIFYFEH